MPFPSWQPKTALEGIYLRWVWSISSCNRAGPGHCRLSFFFSKVYRVGRCAEGTNVLLPWDMLAFIFFAHWVNEFRRLVNPLAFLGHTTSCIYLICCCHVCDEGIPKLVSFLFCYMSIEKSEFTKAICAYPPSTCYFIIAS